MRPFRSKAGLAGVTVITIEILIALAADLVSPYEPTARAGPSYASPSIQHLLGTNDIGQDIFSQLIHGSRVSLLIGIAAAAAATGVGITVGLLSGYHRGRLGAFLMRVTDGVLIVPWLPLMIVLAAFVGPSILSLIGIIAMLAWPSTARVVRSRALSLTQRGFIDAARALGASDFRILTRHLLPFALPLAIPQFVLMSGSAILLEASLSFLGLGDPNTTSWGSILYWAQARGALLTDWWMWWVAPAGIAISLTVLSFTYVGYVLEESADRRVSTGSFLDSVRRRARAAAPDLTDPRMRPKERERALLDVVNLSVTFSSSIGDVLAVRGIDYSIEPGETVAILGESGSGKSVSSRALLGLLPAADVDISGSAMFDGVDLLSLDEPELERLRGPRIAMVFQEAMSALNPVMTIGDQLSELFEAHRGMSRSEGRRAAVELLRAVALTDPERRISSYPHELSGGMRQRVMIAMAIALQPPLVIADEPTSSLDVTVQAQIMALLLSLRDQLGMSLVLITHDIGVAAETADRVLVMYAGRIVETGPVSEVISNPSHPYTKGLLASMPSLDGSLDRLPALPGAPPGAGALATGCAFQPRCAHAFDACRVADPQLLPVGPRTFAACHLTAAGLESAAHA